MITVPNEVETVRGSLGNRGELPKRLQCHGRFDIRHQNKLKASATTNCRRFDF